MIANSDKFEKEGILGDKKVNENDDEYNPSSMDLTVDFNPPKDLFIEVRVHRDYGTV